MKSLKSFKNRFLKNNKGQGMVEYILLIVVVVAIVMAFKGKIKGFMDNWSTKMDSAVTGELDPNK